MIHATLSLPPVIHTFLAQFPLVLCILGAFFLILSVSQRWSWTQTTALTLGAVGCVTGWIALTSAEALLGGRTGALEDARTALVFGSAGFGAQIIWTYLRNRSARLSNLPDFVRIIAIGALILSSGYFFKAGPEGFGVVVGLQHPTQTLKAR